MHVSYLLVGLLVTIGCVHQRENTNHADAVVAPFSDILSNSQQLTFVVQPDPIRACTRGVRCGCQLCGYCMKWFSGGWMARLAYWHRRRVRLLAFNRPGTSIPSGNQVCYPSCGTEGEGPSKHAVPGIDIETAHPAGGSDDRPGGWRHRAFAGPADFFRRAVEAGRQHGAGDLPQDAEPIRVEARAGPLDVGKPCNAQPLTDCCEG